MTSLTAILLLGLVTAASAGEIAPQSSPQAASVAPAHFPGATEAFKCDFEPAGDEDMYALPQGWTRRHGPGYPRYVHIRVDDERPPPGGRSLRVDLNGGAASAFGPAITVAPGVDYVLQGYLKAVGLHFDQAWISLTFLDGERQKVSEVVSEKIGGTNPWQKVLVGPLTPPPRATLLVVGVHVAPQSANEDLRGAAGFGSLWIGQLPRVLLTVRAVEARSRRAETSTTDAPRLAELRGPNDMAFLVFPRGKPIEAACLVSGLAAPQYELRMEVFDSAGRKLAEHKERCATSAQSSLAGSNRATWQIPSDTVGLYRIRATAVTSSAEVKQHGRSDLKPLNSFAPSAELSLAIVNPELPLPQSEFGWSLDPADVRVGLVPMSDLLRQSGVHWVKFPFTCSASPEGIGADRGQAPAAKADGAAVASDGDSQAKSPKKPEVTAGSPTAHSRPADPVEPLISFSDRLSDAGIRLIGVLSPSPDANRGQAPYKLLAVEVFTADANGWYPAIEPVLARLATEIRFWQVGDDGDTGWSSCRDLPAAVSRVKTVLDRIGQDVSVGIAWDFAAPLPLSSAARGNGSIRNDDRQKPAREAPWRFLSFVCDDAVTNAALAAALDDTTSAEVARWVVIDALPRSSAASTERIGHLADRMIAAKTHGADAIFLAHPFDAERGLVGRDGSPNELFLPWRTTALMLGGVAYAGDIDLPGGNAIRCFGGQGTYVGVVPSGAPQMETVCLGDRLMSHDLWGHVDKPQPAQEAGATVVEIGRLPTFLSGLDGAIAEWQLNAAFAPNSLPSIPSAVVPVSLQFKNTLPRAASGRVRIAGPKNWHISPREAEFHANAGGRWTLPLEVALPIDVVAGRQMVAIDFEIPSDRSFHFTMYRPIEVTLGDVAIVGRAALAANGDLEVRQTLVNQGKRIVSFRCNLLAPDRRRQSAEILLPPAAKSEFVYHLADGRDLLGKPLWLRAEEIDGRRVLNYRLEAATREQSVK